jgi:hypothetical protein
MSKKKIFTLKQAKTIGEQLGISWDKFDVAQFRAGMGVELEHGTIGPKSEYINERIVPEVFNHVDTIVVPSIWLENSPLVAGC